MRILQAYPRHEYGGTERMVETLAREWQRAGHDVWTWLPGPLTLPADLPVLTGDAYPRECRPDVVVVHGGILGAAHLGLDGSSAGAPVVEVVHRLYPARPGAARYVAVSRAAALAQTDVRCTVIPNGVASPGPSVTRAEARAALGVGAETLVVARHGRTAMEKGWHWTLRTMERAWDAGADARLLVVGAQGVCGALVRAWAWDRPCVVRDWCARPADLLVAADVYLETSPGEGFGLAAAEAGLLGLPVVAMRAPGVTEVLGDACLSAPAGETAAAATALLRLAGDLDLRRELGARLRRRVETRYDPALCARRYVRLFRSLTG